MRSSTPFQFRHGAIKTGARRGAGCSADTFQFRHGAIKTSISTRFCDDFKCFNSDTVRSKRCSSSCSSAESVVSIPTRCDQNHFVAQLLHLLHAFQFRHGAIKTFCLTFCSTLPLCFNSDTVRSKRKGGRGDLSVRPRFNSDTVRSKPDSTLPPTAAPAPFQFRHGAIKTGDGNVRGDFYARFNSDTVRSKLPLGRLVLRSALSFQFRHGAIKTAMASESAVNRAKFQFRHGAIKTQIRCTLK